MEKKKIVTVLFALMAISLFAIARPVSASPYATMSNGSSANGGYNVAGWHHRHRHHHHHGGISIHL